MGRYYTGVTIIDNLLQLDISKLKQWGCLKMGVQQTGVITWRIRGNIIGEIGYTITINEHNSFIQLNYNFNNISKENRVKLIRIQSNLGKGYYWLFQCPKTLKTCRKLYQYKGEFVHREHCKDTMYESQTKSKKYRLIEKLYGDYFSYEQIYNQYRKKHRKRSYRGIPTKKERVLTSKLENAENKNARDIERMLVFGI